MPEKPRPWGVVAISAAYSALPVIGGPLQTVFDALDERSRDNAEQAANEFSRTIDIDEATYRRRLAENPELETVASEAFSAASRTGWQAKRKLLGRAAAAAFEEDKRLDQSTTTVFALSRLEPVHVRALARLVAASDRAAGGGPDHQDEVAKVQDTIGVPVRAALIQAGCAHLATVFGGGTNIWDVTDFGRELLAHLRDVADEDNERLMLEP